jgi:NADPH:quinone reductase-like Zn-dependent oxidoreductase
MSEMKAWQLATPGEVQDILKLNMLQRPSPELLRADQVLVRVISASINPADFKVPAMGIGARAILSFPNTPGMDLSGEVVAVGAGVRDVLVGDRVMARMNPLKKPGALAEYIVAEHDGYAKISRDVDLDVAAAIGTAGLTAYQTITPYAKAGDRIFINGGSGGVGTFGIQIAKLLGCHVTVSCSTAKAELCRSLGADEIIDYKKCDVVEELTKLGAVFSLIVDNVGFSPLNLYSKTDHVLMPGGVFVLVAAGKHIGHAAMAVGSLLRPSFLGGGKHKMVMYLTANNRRDWTALAQWLNEGKLTAMIEKKFEFEDTLKAFAHLQKETTAGKVVIHVSKE